MPGPFIPVGGEEGRRRGLAILAELGAYTPLDEGKVDRDQARIERAGDERDHDHRGEVPPRLTATAVGASPCRTRVSKACRTDTLRAATSAMCQ
jgi:hypothetical protein